MNADGGTGHCSGSLQVKEFSSAFQRPHHLLTRDDWAELPETSDSHVDIEQYWIVDLDAPVSMITYRLVDGAYENFGEHSGKVELDVAGTPVVLDLDALVAARAQKL
ncbi:hypothetical protein [Amycolatopsis sp. FDAARGOS 1241]|uniref:hypothetical protein n=1 Tax=Amycolatopsis sp. FDAARGOS 1241 TaxID=2778070 RepID=UPI001EF34825|nr:hypothetical protein [Amycolatopsis sp. FDAARGOS 1241]